MTQQQAIMRFGERLRAEIKKQGLTVQVIAKICGISRNYITLIENSKRLLGKKIILSILTLPHFK